MIGVLFDFSTLVPVHQVNGKQKNLFKYRFPRASSSTQSRRVIRILGFRTLLLPAPSKGQGSLHFRASKLVALWGIETQSETQLYYEARENHPETSRILIILIIYHVSLY